MPNSLRTFKDIFEKPVTKDANKNSVCPQKIIIPMVQRDFAQGRDSTEVKRIRNRFLDALHKAVTGKPVKLDFIYGDLNEDGVLTPLDGQQRLTTLFLLHWYAAGKENIPSEKTACLKKFSYEIRPSARDFCEYLTEYHPHFDSSYKTLSKEIEDQSWFSLSWRKDPTIKSILVMLDAIDKKFSNVENLWDKLFDGAISFHFLAIENMGLTDELYITMNSRGKPLTDFEHFKAEFKHKLDEIDAEKSDEVILNVDTKWTNMLWQYRDENNLIDSGFLRYFNFLCDVIRYRAGGTPRGKESDEFALLEEFFSIGSNNVLGNIAFLENCFDCWCDVENIDEFFSDRISSGSKSEKKVNKHSRGKIIVYYDNINFFSSCLNFYGTPAYGRVRKFSLGEFVILYAFQIYLLNRDKISDKDFRRRLRVVNNLVSNSVNSELSDSETRQGGNRMPAMLKQVDNIIIHGEILDKIGPNFNVYQLNEEREKLKWTQNNPDNADLLYKLEDHYLLYGQIGIIGLDNLSYTDRFISLFDCDYDLVNCVMLSLGDYFQIDKRSDRHFQMGSLRVQSWHNLFHRSLYNTRFDETQKWLLELLARYKTFDNKSLQTIIDNNLAYFEKISLFEWSYYYIKYKIFRPNRYGKYYWNDFKNAPYLFNVLWAERRSSNAYQPFLKAIVDSDTFSKHYSVEDTRLVFEDYCIEIENAAYVIRNLKTKEEYRLSITQSDAGIDVEDRIQKFKNWDEKDYLL